MIFGERPIDPCTIAECIAWALANDKRLHNPDGTFVNKNKRYTDVFLEMFCSLAFECACTARHEVGKNGTEKLYDLIWLDDALRMRLAAEIEWNKTPGEIAYDFQKLLYAKTPLKIMIHSRQNQEKTVLPVLRDMLLGYRGHIEGEEYVVIQVMDRQRPERPPRLHAVRLLVPPTDGTLSASEIQFEPLDGAPFTCTQEQPGHFFDPDAYRKAFREYSIAHAKYLEFRMALNKARQVVHSCRDNPSKTSVFEAQQMVASARRLLDAAEQNGFLKEASRHDHYGELDELDTILQQLLPPTDA